MFDDRGRDRARWGIFILQQEAVYLDLLLASPQSLFFSCRQCKVYTLLALGRSSLDHQSADTGLIMDFANDKSDIPLCDATLCLS